MGRRAKNKQKSPEPLEAKVWTTPKKSRKRKADAGDEVDGKLGGSPRKRVKGIDSKARTRVKGAKNKADANGKSPSSKGKVKRKFNSQDSSDGWEDVEDGAHV
jgi:hypothetical protein